VVEAIEKSGGHIAVVKLTVVDRQAGLKALQILLAHLQIPLEPQRSDGVEEERAQQPPNRLVAVYVEATSEQLSAALLQLNQEEQFQELQIEPPIQLARLDVASRDRVARRANVVESLMKSRAVAAKSLGENKDRNGASEGRARAAADEVSKPENAKGFSVEKKAKKNRRESLQKPQPPAPELARISRQLQLSLPADVLKVGPKELEAVLELAESKPAGRKFLNAKPPTSTAAPAAQNSQHAGPLQVLFVLVADHSGTESSGKVNSPPQADPTATPPKSNAEKAGGGAA